MSSELFTLTVAEIVRRLRLVRDLHHPADGGRYCAECSEAYPCDTINIIRAGGATMNYLQSGLVAFTFVVLCATNLVTHDFGQAAICAAGAVVGALGIWTSDIQRRRIAILKRLVDTQAEQLRLARIDRGF